VISIGGFLLHGAHSDGTVWTTSRDDFDGWAGVDTTLDVQGRPMGDGGIAGDAFRTERTVTVGGTVRAPTTEALWAQHAALAAAVPVGDTDLDVTEPGGVVKSMRVRRGSRVRFRVLSPTVGQWAVTLVALDPRKFGAELTGSTGLPSTSGGLTAPFTAPFTVNATQVTGQVALTNPGTLPGPVWLRIAGPFSGPVVTHVSSGERLVFSADAVLPAGSWLDVDMDRHLVLENGQAPRAQWVTGRGWSQFEPGVNVWALTAAVYNAGTLLTVRARPAWE